MMVTNSTSSSSFLLALVESSYAKLRLFRVPQYLGVGFVCALVALALRIL